MGKMSIRSLLARKKSRPQTRSLPSSPRVNSITVNASSTQIQELEHVFHKFDANGDGKISWLELGSIMESVGSPYTEEQLKKMVKEADADGDGFIDLQEFIEINTKGLDSNAMLDDIREAFRIYDLDGNGSISVDELHRVLRNLGEGSSKAECRKMISGVDSDGDGQISFEEFKIMMTKSLSSANPGIH